MTELLLELNPDVSGDFRQADPVCVIAHELHKFRKSHDGLLPLNGRVPDMTTVPVAP